MAASCRSMASESSSTSNRSGWRDGGHGRMRASDLIVQCLENEQVRYVFGLPGEEILDILDSFLDSRITFVPTRHEQGAAFMADAYGRLTGRPGVCLSTLGPAPRTSRPASPTRTSTARPWSRSPGRPAAIESTRNR